MKNNITILCLLLTILSVEASIQFDGTAYYTFAQNPDSGKDLQHIVNLGTDFSVIHPLNEKLDFSFNHFINGIVKSVLLPEQQLPMTNHLSGGLELSAFGNLYVGFNSNMFGYSRNITPPFLSSDQRMASTLLNNGVMHWQLEKKVIDIDASVNYFIHEYELEWKNPALAELQGENPDGSSGEDVDVWVKTLARCKFGKGFNAELKTGFKSDLEENDCYNWDNHHVRIGGNHVFGRKKLFLDWYIGERYVKSEAMFYKNYVDGFSTELFVHPVISLMRGVYLKGAGALEFTGLTMKQRYDIGFQRTWKNRSLILMKGWCNFGGLFPRIGAKINSRICINKFSMVPSFELVWRAKTDDEIEKSPGAFSFSRTITALETDVKIFKSAELVTGFRYLWFQNLDPYTNRGTVYLGIRKW